MTPWTVTVAARLFCPWVFTRPECWSGLPWPPPGDPDPGIEPRSATLQVDSLPSEPPGKPKNPGVGSLSLLQGIFPTQESNQDLLHCRQIPYQLNHQGILSCSEWRLLSGCILQASHCGFSCCRARTLGCLGLSSCGSQPLEHRLSSCGA